jgi:N-acetylneuraminic acid mutarotase
MTVHRHGKHEQMLVAYGGKGWTWRERRHMIDHNVKMLGDMWQFDVEYGTWREVDTGKNRPAARWKLASTLVHNDSHLVLMGGCTATGAHFVQNDLWVFSPEDPAETRWRRVETFNNPVQRRGHVLVHNKTHLIIYGGKTSNKWAREQSGSKGADNCLKDLWAISKNAVLSSSASRKERTWTQGASFPAGCRWGATGDHVQDSKGNMFLALFGGRHLDAGPEHQATSKYTYYNDIWLYDFARNKWLQPSVTGRKPLARDHHGAACMHGQLFIYGGRQAENRSANSVLDDLWSFDVSSNTWHEHVPHGLRPAARYMPGVARVSIHGSHHFAVFAGETLPGSTKLTTRNDVWVYNPTTASWTQLFASTCQESPLNSVSGMSLQQYIWVMLASIGIVLGCVVAWRSWSSKANAREVVIIQHDPESDNRPYIKF